MQKNQNDEDIQRGEDIEKLMSDPIFNKYIKEEFMDKLLKRAVRISNGIDIKDDFIIDRYKNHITAVGVLDNFLEGMKAQGRYAKAQNEEIEDMLSGGSDDE